MDLEVIKLQTEINYKLLGDKIVKKRKTLNMKQKDLANIIGMAISHLSDIERGVKGPSLEMLMKISYALDEPVDYFLKDSSHACRKYIISEELTPILKECTPQSLMVITYLAKDIIRYQNITLTREDFLLDTENK